MPNLLGNDPVWHLLRRATFGPTAALVADVRTKGISAWLDEQLDPSSIDDSACDSYVSRYPTVAMTTAQIHAALPLYSYTAMGELACATIARALFSQRQLFEVMVEFWSNHFNVAIPTPNQWDVKTVHDREVIRRFAVGRFADLLQANATSPAMLRFLNNDVSSASGLNENYGRELLELHTVGVGAGYTQDDVVNSARILTGLTVDANGNFTYRPDLHYVGPVQVLGFTSANSDAASGQQVAQAYLDYLAHHPSTATHLATKLAVRFVADTPPDSLVTKLAQVYLANDTAIAPVLRALFTSYEFAASIGQKTRRPIEDVVGALRAVGTTPASGGNQSLMSLYWLLTSLGQLPMGWRPPNGYPDVAAYWVAPGGVCGRWYAHLMLAFAQWSDGLAIPPMSGLLGSPRPATCGQLVDQVAAQLVGVALPSAQRSALLSFLGVGETTNGATVSSEMLNYLVSLTLSSPCWIQR